LLGLHIPSIGTPDVLYQDLSSAKMYVFGSTDPVISTFDSKSNYYHYPQNKTNTQPINFIATFIKRMYSNNYNCLVKGDILVYSSLDSLPHVIDDSVPMYFLQQIALFLSHQYEN
jgi:hypothetical protein